MTKEEILQKIADFFNEQKNNKPKNSMVVYEIFYNPFYLIGKCFTLDELSAMSEAELKNLFKLANYASEVLY